MLLNGEGTPAQKNAALPGVHKKIEAAAALGDAKTALRPIPAKALATDLDPNAKRARPRLERRGLQMVLRLLAFNAEAWIAEHFNAYLTDPNDYRAIPRNLLHQGGQVDYTTNTITITITLDLARQPPSRPGPPATHRRTQRHTSDHARRPPPTTSAVRPTCASSRNGQFTARRSDGLLCAFRWILARFQRHPHCTNRCSSKYSQS